MTQTNATTSNQAPMTAMPMLGTGTFRLKDKAAFDAVLMALEEGSRHIDTAQIYGNEQAVGDAINASGIPREELFITTKVWTENLTKERFETSVVDSLTALQTEYLDLLLIHWPLNSDEPSMVEYLSELKAVLDKGLTRRIGVSNFTNAQLAQAIAILGEGVIYTNQVEVHPYLINRKVTDFCRQHNVLVTGYMPFAYGAVLQDETIVNLASVHQATPAQIVLAWLRQLGFATIPSSTKRDNVRSNLTAASINLTPAEIEQINQLDRNHRVANPDFAPHWD
ncbi:2,5-didehydrogluconate reductase DkgB [Shewanella mangrovisoli]|uniref:2,5-didehydrogluconate reductase DkgB n=1 Tax=Shewanella mangrovisoli TaxID=2864211 RepID=UPI001C65BB4C|nr:2,5-didehydrogluconate reductase DkgB [Shewanella mangrovisoli]QYK08684.1 2,5-didehydrogluconate reductase DkgB [Shewanella mangrovisoli]